jgi:Regulator of chromosome condensation (RCC1) repeat
MRAFRSMLLGVLSVPLVLTAVTAAGPANGTADRTGVAQGGWSMLTTGKWQTCGIRGNHSSASVPTWTGTFVRPDLPRPSWPTELRPQHHKVWSTWIPHVYLLDAHVPTQVGSHATWTSVHTACNTSCGTTSGQGQVAWCFGDNRHGAIGNGHGGPHNYEDVPVRVASGPGDWQAVVAGDDFSCGIGVDRSAWCWGYDLRGQVGDGGYGIPRRLPVQVRLG